MKIFKLILILAVSISISSCGSDDDGGTVTFDLTNANLAGNYDVSLLNIDGVSTTVVSGATVQVSTTTVVGDTFQLTVTFTEEGTFTITGQYRTVTTITPTGLDPIEDEEIQVVDDSGTYTVNTTDQTITIVSTNDSLLDGTFNVATFNQTNVNLTQEDQIVDGGITTDLTGSLNLVRQ